MYGYIYLTTCSTTGKKYIGQHRSSEFDEKYLGSGQHLKAAVKKYGKDNFSVCLLKECFSEEELNASEIEAIAQNNAVLSKEFYNISLGGATVNLLYQTDETKQKISMANSGRKRTQSQRDQASSIRKGSKWLNNGQEQTIATPKNIEHYLKLGWVFGQLKNRKSSPKTEEAKQNISNALKGKKKAASHIEKHRVALLKKKMHWYTDGSQNLLIPENEIVPTGFYRGKYVTPEAKELMSKNRKGIPAWNKGIKRTSI